MSTVDKNGEKVYLTAVEGLMKRFTLLSMIMKGVSSPPAGQGLKNFFAGPVTLKGYLLDG